MTWTLWELAVTLMSGTDGEGRVWTVVVVSSQRRPQNSIFVEHPTLLSIVD